MKNPGTVGTMPGRCVEIYYLGVRRQRTTPCCSQACVNLRHDCTRATAALFELLAAPTGAEIITAKLLLGSRGRFILHAIRVQPLDLQMSPFQVPVQIVPEFPQAGNPMPPQELPAQVYEAFCPACGSRVE